MQAEYRRNNSDAWTLYLPFASGAVTTRWQLSQCRRIELRIAQVICGAGGEGGPCRGESEEKSRSGAPDDSDECRAQIEGERHIEHFARHQPRRQGAGTQC